MYGIVAIIKVTMILDILKKRCIEFIFNHKYRHPLIYFYIIYLNTSSWLQKLYRVDVWISCQVLKLVNSQVNGIEPTTLNHLISLYNH